MSMSFDFPRPFPGTDRLKPGDEECRALSVSHALSGRPRRVMAALSGGADSTALVCMLSSLREEMGIELAAVHVNHGLRESAERDEAFCAQLCSLLDIPLRTVRLRMSGRSEDEARSRRYAALSEEAARAGAAVATAHHMKDQGETFLLSLMRGSVRGLGGMREVSLIPGTHTVLWRPLLAFSPEALRSYLSARFIPWTEDETNADPSYLRNAVRGDILPRMEKARRGTLKHIVTAERILREESDYMDREAMERLHGRCALSPCPFILSRALYDAPRALRRRMLRLFLDAMGLSGHTDTRTLEDLSDLETGGFMNCGGGYRVLRGEKYLFFIPPFSSDRPPEPEKLPFAGDHGDGRRRQSAAAELLSACEMRYPLPGDFIVPFGRKGRCSLNDFLSRRHVERGFRSRVPVLARGDEVLWAVGAGASEALRGSGAHEERVLLFWPHPLPGEEDLSLFRADQYGVLSDFGL